tara:strand:- start:44855 stop:46642 length:1788 start_codon:yes stop_codon:yes gene_type:complete
VGQFAFAESELPPASTVIETPATENTAANAANGQASPVAPDVKLRDVTSIEAVVEASNAAPAASAQADPPKSAVTPPPVPVSTEDAANDVPAESGTGAEKGTVGDSSATGSSADKAKTVVKAAESIGKTAEKRAKSAKADAKPDAAAKQPEPAPASASAEPDQVVASVTIPDDKGATASSAAAAVNPKAEAVAKAFSAKLIGETPPEPDKSGTDEANETEAVEASRPLSAEIEDPPRPKAVVGEPSAPVETPAQDEAADLRLLGSIVKPGTAARLGWSPGVAISGLDQPTPVLVVHGAKPGPTLCLTSAVHGDELNGIEVVRGVMYDLDPKDLSGTVIGVPIVNLQGFNRGSRYLVDRRDLNRFFPGYASGSMASRIAASLFNEIVLNCNMLVDIHTGSLRRANLPQLRADMRSEKVVEFTKGFDNMVVVHSPGSPGMMRSAAVDRGIASVTLEIGESLRIQRDEIKAGIHSINSLLEKQDMYQRLLIWGEPRPVFYNSTWLRTERGGILESHIELGARVEKGDSLGVVIDPITNKGTDIISDIRGRVIGMAVDQVVMPGFATYHIGIESSERALGFQTEIQGRAKDAEPPTVEE